MMALLMTLAWKLEYYQRRELRLVDATWFRRSDGTRHIAVEVENRPKTIFKREVPDLLKDTAPLKIVISEYPDTPSPGYGGYGSAQGWQREVLLPLVDSIIRRHENQGQIEPAGGVDLLILLADRPPGRLIRNWWHGFAWKRSGGEWLNVRFFGTPPLGPPSSSEIMDAGEEVEVEVVVHE